MINIITDTHENLQGIINDINNILGFPKENCITSSILKINSLNDKHFINVDVIENNCNGFLNEVNNYLSTKEILNYTTQQMIDNGFYESI